MNSNALNLAIFLLAACTTTYAMEEQKQDHEKTKPQPQTFNFELWPKRSYSFLQPILFIVFCDEHGNIIKGKRYEGPIPVTRAALQRHFGKKFDLSMIQDDEQTDQDTSECCIL